MLDNIKKLYLYSFFSSLTFYGAVSIPFFLYWGKLNYTQLFLLQTWFMVWLFIMEVPTGVVADKFGRKTSLFLASLTLSAATFIYSQIPNFYVFLLAEFLFAVGIALSSGTDKAMLYDTLKEMNKTKQSKHFFSRYALFDTLGIVVAFPIGTLIAGSAILAYPNVLALPMLLTSVPIFISALIALTVREPKRTKPDENPVLLGIKGIKYLRNHKILRSFAIDMALIAATTHSIFWLYQPLFLNAGLELKILGFAAAGFNVFSVLLLAKIKFIEDRIGIRKMLIFTAILPGLFFVVLAFFRELWIVLIGVYIIAGLKLLRQPLFDHYMNKYIKSSDRATVLSATSMLARILTALLYPLIGFLADISIYHSVGFLGLLTLVFAVFVRVDEKYLEK